MQMALYGNMHLAYEDVCSWRSLDQYDEFVEEQSVHVANTRTENTRNPGTSECQDMQRDRPAVPEHAIGWRMVTSLQQFCA